MLLNKIIAIVWMVVGLLNLTVLGGNESIGAVMVVGGYIILTLTELWDRLNKITAIVIRGTDRMVIEEKEKK